MALALTSRRRALAAGASALAAIALAVAVVGRGCRVGEAGPENAVRAFIQAARAGDRQALFELLSPDTQRRLEDQAQKSTRLVSASVRYRALDLINVGVIDDPPAPSEVELVEQSGDHATVRIDGAGGTAQISVIRVDGSWRLDLPSYGTDL